MNNLIVKKIESFKHEIEKSLFNLCSIPAISPESGGNGEYDKSLFIKELLNGIAIQKISEYNAPDKNAKKVIRPNIIAEIKGKDKSKTINIVTHMDVVPEGEINLWTKCHPFKPIKIGNRMYGRGTEDNGQSLIASIYAVKALLELEIIPKYNVRLIFVSDEETGSKYGIQYLLEQDIFNKNDLFLVPDYGDEEGTIIEIAEKRVLWLEIKTVGKQCHGSMPDKGTNAFLMGSRFLVKLYDHLHNNFNYNDSLFDPPISTFEPTKKIQNVPNVNTIPGVDIFYMDNRVLPKYSFKEIDESICQLKKNFEAKNKVKVQIKNIITVPGSYTPLESEIVKLLKNSIEKIRKIKVSTIGIGGGTCSAFFRNKGYDAAVWETVRGTEHQPNEFCNINNLINDSIIFADILVD